MGINLSEKILFFLFELKFPFALPEGAAVLNVYKDKIARNVCTEFYRKYFKDNNERYIMLGINPGRFGGGITGIPFTDPVRLQNECGIENPFEKKQELSSVFMYEMMRSFGGVKKFYSRFYISAISPLGFIKNGKNLNYYDDKLLIKSIESFVVQCLETQLSFGLNRQTCFCIGEGKNYGYLLNLNKKYKWFIDIKALPHPRFIMQYKLKTKDKYIEQYIQALSEIR